MTLTKEKIIFHLDRISKFAFDNLQELAKLNIDLKKEPESFYLGIINRQYTLTKDLSILFVSKNSIYLGSQLILFRCILDDFIHLIYIINQSDSNEAMTKFNSDAYNKNFKRLEKLATLNETKLGGNYPQYPTYEWINDKKNTFRNESYSQKYFINKEDFKLKSFDSMGNMIFKLKDENYSHKLRRAYYFWGYLSDFVHYSNYSFGIERRIKPETDGTYLIFAEILQNSYEVIKTSFEYFKNSYNINIIDNGNLAEYYKDSEH